MERVIRGTLVSDDKRIENGWIAVENGRIAAIGQGPPPSAADIDDQGTALILPGVIDGQTHADMARFFGINDRKGAIAEGLDADIVVVEEGAFTWDEAAALDGLNWSPFHGQTFDVRVAATYLRGAPAWDGNAICNSAGSGQYTPRRTAGWYA